MKGERWIILGVVVLAVLFGVAAQTGLLDRPAGALVGSAVGLDVPALDDPAMIRRGAAHYDRVCARCHASPDRPDQADALDLSPSPPKLHQRLEGWAPELLFRTVKRGVPRSGMPAWPTDKRDDEIWSMVAFLGVLPGMDAQTYRSLAGLTPETTALPAPLTTCARCHGAGGRGSPDGAFPRLDIQTSDYLLAALHAFRDGRRASGFMQSAVSGLRDDELAALAEHFGDAPPAAAMAPGPGAAGGDRVPACTACHGPPHPARPEFPSIAGQYQSYLLTQLQLLADRDDPRGGGPFVGLMHEAAHALTEAQMVELAKRYSSMTTE